MSSRAVSGESEPEGFLRGANSSPRGTWEREVARDGVRWRGKAKAGIQITPRNTLKGKDKNKNKVKDTDTDMDRVKEKSREKGKERKAERRADTEYDEAYRAGGGIML